MNQDRMELEAMADGFTAAERVEYEAAERALRLRDTVPGLRTNCATGEAISPSGALSDQDVGRLEDVRRQALLRYGSG
jgi:hypothetical protein